MIIRTEDGLKFEKGAFEDRELRIIGGRHNIENDLPINATIMGFMDNDSSIVVAACKWEFPPVGMDRYKMVVTVDEVMSGKCIIIPIKS